MAVAKKKSGPCGKSRRGAISRSFPQKGAGETVDEVTRISKAKTVRRIVPNKSATKGVLAGFARAVQQVVRSGKPVQMTVVIAPDATAPRIAVEELEPAWMTRCRRLVKDYERYAETLAGFHVVAFACLMLKRAAEIMIQGA